MGNGYQNVSFDFRNLIDSDVFSKSDPMCVVYLQTLDIRKWKEICRTEVIDNTLNPDFTTKVSFIKVHWWLGLLGVEIYLILT